MDEVKFSYTNFFYSFFSVLILWFSRERDYDSLKLGFQVIIA